MEQTIKLPVIKPESIIKIEVGGGFYQRLQQLLFSFEKQDPERALKTIAAFKERDPQDAWEENFLTILTLIYEIEQKAQEQGLIIENEYKINKD